jgi:outer membrane protein
MYLKRGAAIILFFAGLFYTEIASGQDVLTLEEAILIGLEENYGILIARNEAEIHAINRSIGSAGFLPSIDISGSRLELLEYVRESIEGVSQGTEPIDSEIHSIDFSLDWTFFDGLRMFTTYNRLTQLRNLGETEARIQIENTITEIIYAYYGIIRYKKLLSVLEGSIEVSEERVRIAETKQELGSGSEYEMLLALADLNTDRAHVVRQEVILNDAKLHLMRLLAMDAGEDIEIYDVIELGDELNFDVLYGHFTESNPELRAADLRANISRMEVNEIRTERLPELELNLGYGAVRDEWRNSGIFMEELRGFSLGITARFNVFDGFNTNRRVQMARINQRNRELEVQDSFKELEMLLRSEYKNYTNTRRLVELENETHLASAEIGPVIVGHLGEFRSGDLDRTSVDRIQTGETIEQCGLAASRGAP